MCDKEDTIFQCGNNLESERISTTTATEPE